MPAILRYSISVLSIALATGAGLCLVIGLPAAAELSGKRRGGLESNTADRAAAEVSLPGRRSRR